MIHVSNMAVPTPRRSPQETSFVSRRDLTQLRLGSVPMCLQVCKYSKRLATINFIDTYFPSKIQIVKFWWSIITFQAGWLDGPTGEIGPSANRSQLVARASSSATATATLQHLTLVKAIQSRQLCVHPLSLLSKYQQGQHPIQVRILQRQYPLQFNINRGRLHYNFGWYNLKWGSNHFK